MSGAWRGLSVSFPLSLHLQINSLLTEKKINNQNCHNETVSAKPFNWSMESKCNYLRNNCMEKKKKKTSVEGGLWGQWGLRMLSGYRIEWWKLKKVSLRNTYSTILKLQKALLLFWVVWAKKRRRKIGRIKLHSVQYEIPLWIDGWMDSCYF